MQKPISTTLVSFSPDLAINTSMPKSGLVPIHWFPELVKIFANPDPTTPLWTGGSLMTFKATLNDVLTQHQQPSVKDMIIDIEHPRMPLDDSQVCLDWINVFITGVRQFYGVPVGLFNPFVYDVTGRIIKVWYPTFQDKLNVDLYPPNTPVVETTSDGQEPIWHYLQYYGRALLMCRDTKKPVMSDICGRHFYDRRDGNYLIPLSLEAVRMQVELARLFGEVNYYDEIHTPLQAEETNTMLQYLNTV